MKSKLEKHTKRGTTTAKPLRAAHGYAPAVRELKRVIKVLREQESKSRRDGFWWDARANGERATALECAVEHLTNGA